MSSVAIITARGGSKRIPRKNVRHFCGQPILAYSIEAAVKSGIFDEVMVSTDDAEIAAIAQTYGANIPFMRSAETSDDFATTADVLMEVLDAYRAHGQSFDTMCCIYPTAPFVTSEKLCAAWQEFRASDADMMETVVPFSFPPQRSFSMVKGKMVYNYPEDVRKRSQDLPTWYHDAGQFYFYRVPAFLTSMQGTTEQRGYNLSCVPFLLSELEVQDIDNLSDWQLAELKYRLMKGNKE